MLAELSRHLVLRLVYQLLTQWTAPDTCPRASNNRHYREIKHGLFAPPRRMITKVTAAYSSRDLSSFLCAIKPQVSCLCMCAVSTLDDLREGYSELWSVLPSWAVRVWRFHRHLKKKKPRISLCKHAVWLERVEEGSIQAVLWVTAFILLHYLQEQFWQVQQMDRLWYAIEISDKA